MRSLSDSPPRRPIAVAIVASLAVAAVVVLVPACTSRHESTVDSAAGPTVAATADGGAPTDSAFADVQRRGAGVMGVDQYTSAHVFEDRPDGGRIVLDRADAGDDAGIATVRRHMREVADDVRRGDFAKPFAVHAQVVPGTGVMAARRAAIDYAVVDRPAGAEVRITTADPAAVAAIHAFLAFQRSDHRAAGHEGHAAHVP